MLRKPAHKWSVFGKGTKKLFIGLAGLELVGFLGSFGIWTRMNTEPDFRFYMHENYNWVLEGFYNIEEILSDTKKTRQLDYHTWHQEGKIH